MISEKDLFLKLEKILDNLIDILIFSKIDFEDPNKFNEVLGEIINEFEKIQSIEKGELEIENYDILKIIEKINNFIKIIFDKLKEKGE